MHLNSATTQIGLVNSGLIFHSICQTGTGKTVVGIHIVYQFFNKNKEFLAASCEPSCAPQQKKPAILYCGPSNKSVDIVAGKFAFGDLHQYRKTLARFI